MGSTRLPGKVLSDIAGEPMLARVVERVRRAQGVDEVVVATTDTAADDVLAKTCARRNWICYRGSENDVLDRYFSAARAHDADVVVRITSDCPLLSPRIVGWVLARLADDPAADYASNTLEPRTFPRGLDVEAFSVEALERAWREGRDPAWREHVTPYIYRSGAFCLGSVRHESDLSSHRWTVDTPEDLSFARAVYDALPESFEWTDVLALLERRPELVKINGHISQKLGP